MRSSLMGAFVALAIFPALAQTPEGTPTRIRGTVDRIEGQTLLVRNSGQGVPVTMGRILPSAVWCSATCPTLRPATTSPRPRCAGPTEICGRLRSISCRQELNSSLTSNEPPHEQHALC